MRTHRLRPGAVGLVLASLILLACAPAGALSQGGPPPTATPETPLVVVMDCGPLPPIRVVQ